jgi:hypothetical protein
MKVPHVIEYRGLTMVLDDFGMVREIHVPCPALKALTEAERETFLEKIQAIAQRYFEDRQRASRN